MFKKYTRKQEKEYKKQNYKQNKIKTAGLNLTYQYMHYIQMS